MKGDIMGLLLCSLQVEANPQNLLAGAGLVGAGLLAFHNVNKGNGDVSVNPTLGLNYNHKTGSFAPTLGANVQVTILSFKLLYYQACKLKLG